MSVAAFSRPATLLGARRTGRCRVPDDELRQHVYKALARFEPIRRVSLPQIGIEAEKGVVTLRGHAASDTHKSVAAGLAADVPGVQAVRNELVSDGELQRDLVRAFQQHPETRTVHGGSSVDLGVVTLWGPAPNDAFANAAPDVALSVPGVRAVLNLLSFDRGAARRERIVNAIFGRAAVSRERQLGSVAQLLVEPRSWRVKFALVKHGVLAPQWLLIPAERLSCSDQRYVYVDLQPSELGVLPRYFDDNLSEAIMGDQPDLAGLWRLGASHSIITQHDGSVGRLAGLRIDPVTAVATHVWVRRGRFMPALGWLPLGHCVRWGDDILTLLSKEEVEDALESGEPKGDRDIIMDAYNRVLALRWHREPAGIVGLSVEHGRVSVRGKLWDERDVAAVKQVVAAVREVTDIDDKIELTPAPNKVVYLDDWMAARQRARPPAMAV